MDLNYLVNNDEINKFYLKNLSEKILIDKNFFYSVINYLDDKIFINYLLIIFFLSCGCSIYLFNYEKNKNNDYILINNKQPFVSKEKNIENV